MTLVDSNPKAKEPEFLALSNVETNSKKAGRNEMTLAPSKLEIKSKKMEQPTAIERSNSMPSFLHETVSYH